MAAAFWMIVLPVGFSFANHESSAQPPLWTPLDEVESMATMAVPGGMVTVPAGEFIMGSDPRKDPAAGPQEQPLHRVTLDGPLRGLERGVPQICAVHGRELAAVLAGQTVP